VKNLLAITLLLCVNYVFGQGSISAKKDSAKSDGKIFTLVEEMPQFPGGEKELHKFLTGNIKYPLDLQGKKGNNTVYLTFVVEKDGSIRDIKILRGINEAIDSDVMRVMLMMPKWIPGKQNGKTVNVQFMLPIKFAAEQK
jgi:TonB family protein